MDDFLLKFSLINNLLVISLVIIGLFLWKKNDLIKPWIYSVNVISVRIT